MHTDKYQSFLQVDFNALDIKVSYKVILLLMVITKHSQSTQSNKFAISLQYLIKEVRNGVHFLHADKHQSFYKWTLSILMEVVRHVQSTQNKKLVIILQYLKKKMQQLLFDTIHSDVLRGSSYVHCYLLLTKLIVQLEGQSNAGIISFQLCVPLYF